MKEFSALRAKTYSYLNVIIVKLKNIKEQKNV